MRLEDILFAIYLIFGAVTLLVCHYLRYKRKKASILWVPFSNDIVMIVYIAAWPIFLPFLLIAVFSKGDADEEIKWIKDEDD